MARGCEDTKKIRHPSLPPAGHFFNYVDGIYGNPSGCGYRRITQFLLTLREKSLAKQIAGKLDFRTISTNNQWNKHELSVMILAKASCRQVKISPILVYTSCNVVPYLGQEVSEVLDL